MSSMSLGSHQLGPVAMLKSEKCSGLVAVKHRGDELWEKLRLKKEDVCTLKCETNKVHKTLSLVSTHFTMFG